MAFRFFKRNSESLKSLRCALGLGSVLLFLISCSDVNPTLTSMSSLVKVTKVDGSVSNPLAEGSQVPGGVYRFSGNCRPQVTGFKIKLDNATELVIPNSSNSYPDFTTTNYVINKTNIAAKGLTGSRSTPTPSLWEAEYFPDSTPLPFDLDCSDGRFDFYLFKSTIEWIYSSTSDFPAGIDKPSKVTITPMIPGAVPEPVVFQAELPIALKLDFDNNRRDSVFATSTTFASNQVCSAYNNHGCIDFKLQLATASGSEIQAKRNYSFDIVIKNSAGTVVNITPTIFQVIPSVTDSGYAAILSGSKYVGIELKTAGAGGAQIPFGYYKIIVSERSAALPTVEKEFVVRDADRVRLMEYSNLDFAFKVPMAKSLYYLSSLNFRDIGEGFVPLYSAGETSLTKVFASNLGSSVLDSVFGNGSSPIQKLDLVPSTSTDYDMPLTTQLYMLTRITDASAAQSKNISLVIKSSTDVNGFTYDWIKWPTMDIKGAANYPSTNAASSLSLWFADHNVAYATGHPIIYNLSESMANEYISISHVTPEAVGDQKGHCYELRLARGTQDEAILYTGRRITSGGDDNTPIVTLNISGSKYSSSSGWSSWSDSGLRFYDSESNCKNWNSTSAGFSSTSKTLNTASTGAYYGSVWVRYEYPFSDLSHLPTGGKVKITVVDNADSSKFREYILYLKASD